MDIILRFERKVAGSTPAGCTSASVVITAARHFGKVVERVRLPPEAPRLFGGNGSMSVS